MKKISVLIPCYNEVENAGPISKAVTDILEKELPQYDYELVFIDNDSTDGTRDVIRGLCKENPRIKAIFNARNFGQFNSPYYGMLQVTGDCVIEMVADFQDPVEMIPKYVHEWEKGYKIVIGIKTSSKENKFMYWLRTCYYKTIKKMSDVEQIEHFTGSGLYDREFIEILRKLDDPTPFLRGIVAELGYKRKEIPYEQPKRRAGKTHNNFYRLYDAAMLSVTSYTKEGLRLATIFGGVCAAGSMIIALIYLVMKLIWWDRFPAGMAPMLIGMLFLGSVQLFFIGFLGEYIMSINQRVMKRPLVIEEERLKILTEGAKYDVFAYHIEKNYDRMNRFKTGVLPYLLALAVVAALLMMEPHLSGTILICTVALSMIIVGGIRPMHFLALAVTGVAAIIGIVLYLSISKGYGYFQTRIQSWLDPFADSQGGTWQTCQSLIAIGSGGLFGLGLGESRQKYLYLPETKNDFVFSIVCEELGFVGALTVVLLFVLLLVRGFYIASHAHDKFGMLLTVGFTVHIGLQAFINIGVVSNLIPNTGQVRLDEAGLYQ